MSDNLIDARGLSCPEPVLLTKQALKDYPGGDFTVAVSSPTAKDNVLVLLERSGFSPVLAEIGDAWQIKVPVK